jgi:hypothetical protein
VTVHNDEQPKRCAECGNIVHADGTTALPLWNGHVGMTTVFIIQDGPQYENVYRGPGSLPPDQKVGTGEERAIIIHAYETEDVPLPGLDDLVPDVAGTVPECE